MKIKTKAKKRDPLYDTLGSPTGNVSPLSVGVVKPSSVIVAGMDITTWPIVEIDVPAGPLGILLDGSCTEAAILDDFAPVTREGSPGAIEANGSAPQGSVLIGMDKFDFMNPRQTLDEIGAILREAAHLKRQLRFKVPPSSIQKQAKNPQDDDKVKLITGPTSSATNLNENAGEPSNNLWSATTLTSSKATLTSSKETTPNTEPVAPSPLKISRPASFVQVTGMDNRPLESDKRSYAPSTTDNVVSVLAPPGSLGLNLDGTVANRAVVLGFVPLPDGSRGVLERSGSVSSGAEIVEINGEDVSQEPLTGIRERLRRMSDEPRRLSFRLPPPIKLTVQPLPTTLTTPATSSPSAPKARRMSATSIQRMSLIQASLPTYREDLELRRRLELKLIMSHDRKELKFKEFWFAVHSDWMNRWALYVGKGGPEPGPITNHELLEPGFDVGEDPNRVAFVRSGLEITKDFRFVTPMVWSLLAALHGPGDAPPIARYALDINSEAPEDVTEVLREAKAQASGLATSVREKCQVEDK
ncbi:Deubiquitinating enzyme domain-containing protein [Phytophthora infestans]|uniref:Deubiquitinating enzyme domain-containing protein n=1 Tax=Phytophthora infestans TaxID=4787 RepID=A0A8S9UM67_PHYIN|nr:Deubiquitinating enzyme domain-containing protein [Phytophthora infestans]